MASYTGNKIASGSTNYVNEMDNLIDAIEADMTLVESNSDASKVKTDFITVTQAVDLDTIESNSDASKVKTDFMTVTQAVNLDTIEINSDASKVKTDFITITQAVNLDTIEINSDASKVKTDFINVSSSTDLENVLENDEAGTISGDRTHTGKVKLQDFNETPASYTVTTGTKTLDTSLATFFYGTGAMTAVAYTFAFSNAEASKATTITIELRAAGTATSLVWPASVVWPGGVIPTWSTAGYDIVSFVTRDGGTKWFGFLGGLDFS